MTNKNIYNINKDIIANEEMHGEFYTVCTNLDDDLATLIKINHRR